ncbi:hypothetical protein K492DRAFT_198043 [Lichtheimia hyalospora FSU 10163]|nr:hypothetical protein K492DRAFT_198043 [Lichtheimia hyalospora FSU 10163]
MSHSVLWVRVVHSQQGKHYSLMDLTMKQQKHKIHGMEIELVQARMKLSNMVKNQQGFRSVALLLAARQGCHCINLYCLKGDAKFPSALAPSALVPNAIKLRGLIY